MPTCWPSSGARYETLDDLHHKLVGHLSQAELKELIQLLEKVRAPWAKADERFFLLINMTC